ncbi:MAG: hypothetical protein MZV64_09050 [Ignavibacteriales bacterium]|nr:hypothetical protein [Ignavibacteriales bacterium]
MVLAGIGKSDHWTALSFGAGLNARGAIQIIVATIGLSFGVISQEIFFTDNYHGYCNFYYGSVYAQMDFKYVKPKAAEIERLEAWRS